MQFLPSPSLQQLQIQPQGPAGLSPSNTVNVLQLLQALQPASGNGALFSSAGLNTNPSIPSPNLDFHVRPLGALPSPPNVPLVSNPAQTVPPLAPPLASLLNSNSPFSPLGQSLASSLLQGKSLLPAHNTIPPPLTNLSSFQAGMNELLKGFDQSSKGCFVPCGSSISDEEASQADTNAGSRGSPDSDEAKGKKSSATYLTEEQAREIYSLRPQAKMNKGASANFSYSRSLSSKYGVDARTLRDIWNRRTWVKATFDLWTPQEVKQYKESFYEQYKNAPLALEGEGPPLRVRGRPKGAKDSRPRKVHKQGRGTPSP